MAIDQERLTRTLQDLEEAISQPSTIDFTPSSCGPRVEPLDLSALDPVYRQKLPSSSVDLHQFGLNMLPPTSPLSPTSPQSELEYSQNADAKAIRSDIAQDLYFLEEILSPVDTDIAEDGQEQGASLDFLLTTNGYGENKLKKVEPEPLILSSSASFTHPDRRESEAVKLEAPLVAPLPAQRLPYGSTVPLSTDSKSQKLDYLCCSTTSTTTLSTMTQSSICGDISKEVKCEPTVPTVLKEQDTFVGDIDPDDMSCEMIDPEEDKIRESSCRIFAVPFDRSSKIRKKTRTYSRAVASRFCHICTRQKKGPDSHAVCHNVKNGTCRKTVCQKCFFKFGWDWDAVRYDDALWLCPHCCNLCPQGAQCYNYEKATQEKSPKRTRNTD